MKVTQENFEQRVNLKNELKHGQKFGELTIKNKMVKITRNL